MNKHPMLSVEEAAKLMGCDERWVRERLNQGQLKGEKKNIGLKEKWFVYAGEVEAAVARQPTSSVLSSDYLASSAKQSQSSNNTHNSDEPIVVDAWSDDTETPNTISEEDRLSWLEDQRQALAEMAEEMMRPLMAQLQEKDKQLEEKEKALQGANYRLGFAEGRMKDQDEQIKLLPDFQARAEKAELLKLEVEAATARASELEKNLAVITDANSAEIKRLSAEKEQLASTHREELEALKARITGLEQSWWKKFFGVR